MAAFWSAPTPTMAATSLLQRSMRNFRLFYAVQAQQKVQSRSSSSRLAEVGILESPKLQGKYDTGQLFLHRVFGYRGVVLFPWIGKVYDRDIGSVPKDDKAEGIFTSSKEVKGRTHTYYQVLVDGRDIPHIRVGAESVTFLSNQGNSGTLYSIPGLDYVAHEDALPYKTTEKQPVHNHLFDKFLAAEESGNYIARDSLREWQDKNHPWLELTDVHRETTENIRITVMPFYIGCREVQQTHVYWWRYCIRLENLGEETVQLRERHWRIFSLSGTLETVRGRGIIGKEPVFNKLQPAFQYTSHVSLQAPSGHMWGTFKMERQDGSTFECRIPPFSLESKQEDGDSPHGFII